VHGAIELAPSCLSPDLRAQGVHGAIELAPSCLSPDLRAQGVHGAIELAPSCLSPDLRAQGVHGAIELARQGRPLNVMVTYRPPEGLSDAKAKRWINLRHGRIGQALKRRDHAFIGLKVFEKRPGERLHAHGLYHVPKLCMDVIERAVDVFELRARWGQKGDEPMHARPAKADAVGYVLKQRRWAGPDIESNRLRPLRYQRGGAIVGVRLSFTKDAKAKIWPTAKAVAEPAARTVAGQSLEREAA
jgi:hypothetical protein